MPPPRRGNHSASPTLLACALLRAADAAAAAADRDAAASRLQQVAELAGQLRARPLLQQISRAARRARVEITGGEVTAAAPFGLTGRRSLPHLSCSRYLSPVA